MDETKSESSGTAINHAQADWTVETVADQILRTLNCPVTRETLLAIIEQVATRYDDARIQTFVPILIQRGVMDELLTMQETLVRPEVGLKEVHQSERN